MKEIETDAAVKVDAERRATAQGGTGGRTIEVVPDESRDAVAIETLTVANVELTIPERLDRD